MKRKAIILASALVFTQTPAHAETYVKVDAQGNAIGGAIVCDPITCGAGSEYSRLTLGNGESYALQGMGTTGIGNNNPNTLVKVDLETNDWTVTHTDSPVIQQFNPTGNVVNPIAQPIESHTVVTDTLTVLSDTTTATLISQSQFDFASFWKIFIAWFEAWFSVWSKL